MLQSAAARYTEVRNATATPGELLLALYDGLFRFMNQAKACIAKKDLARARELLSRSNAIVSELMIALDHAVHPELCANLEGVYGFCMDRLTLAARKADPAAIDEVISVLTPLRDAWRLAVPKAIAEMHGGSRP